MARKNRKEVAFRFLAVGDLHLRDTNPKSRNDDYWLALKNKLIYLLDYDPSHTDSDNYDNKFIDGLFFAGDVFDKPTASYSLINKAIKIFQRNSTTCYMIFGQHDLRYHTSDYHNTPLSVLDSADSYINTCTFDIIGTTTFSQMLDFSIEYQGVSWGNAVQPIVKEENMRICNLHRPITVEELPWDHADLITAEKLLDENPHIHIFITGDNHKHFVYEKDGRYVFNMGSVMRSNISQKEHKPCFADIKIYSDKSVEYDIVYFPIADDVFKEEDIQEQKEKDIRIQQFVEALQKDYNPALNFAENLRVASGAHAKEIQEIINEVLGE